MIFEWDAVKSESNKEKHGISFSEAEIAFEDLYAIEELDAEHSTSDESRFKMLAMANGKVLVVIYTMREENFRIVSARKAENYEREFYEKQRREDTF